MKHILLALVFILAGALIFSVATNNALWHQVVILRNRLDNAQAELEVYHINAAKIRALDEAMWEDTMLLIPNDSILYDSTFAQAEDSLEGE